MSERIFVKRGLGEHFRKIEFGGVHTVQSLAVDRV